MKEKIEKWYRQGLWTAQMVQDAVTKKKLTAEEAAEILAADGGGVSGDRWRRIREGVVL